MGIILSNVPYQFNSVHNWHLNICKNDIGTAPFYFCQCFTTVGCLCDNLKAVLFPVYGHFKTGAHKRLIVYNDDLIHYSGYPFALVWKSGSMFPPWGRFVWKARCGSRTLRQGAD